MNDHFDRLEAELAALRPHDASPELRQRIADHQARSGPSRSIWPWGLALAAGLAAAALAAIVFPWAIKTPGNAGALQVRTAPELPVEVEPSAPTLMAYQRALARSPEALEVRLDKDAALPLGHGSQLVQISAFSRSDAALQALLGEN